MLLDDDQAHRPVEIALQMPCSARPIIVLGAGSIVRDAHLPAYRKAGFEIIGIADLDLRKAEALGHAYDVSRCFSSNRDAIRWAPENVVYDLAVPAASLLSGLKELPDGSAVLMQKPMGETFAEATAILNLCRMKRLIAAVNFQLRWSPNIVGVQDFIRRGLLGDVHDFELQVSCRTPWDTWDFLAKAPRLEILYHSIHYLDLARALLGEPLAVYAKTVRSPLTAKLRATKSVITLDYGDWIRAYIATDHSNSFGARHQRSFLQLEGTLGAVHARIGANLDYPVGLPDTLEVSAEGEAWRTIETRGTWFPDAFAGSMASLQCFLEGSSPTLPTSVEDAIRTMALVEAAYASSEDGGTEIPLF